MGGFIVGAALGVIGTLVVLHMSPRACGPGGGGRCKSRTASQATATLQAPSASLPPNRGKPYVSSCIIKVGPHEVLETLAGKRPEGPPPDVELIAVRMLGYESVMAALADTDLMGELDMLSERDPDRRGQLEDALHRRIVEDTTIERIGERLIRVSHRDETPDLAVDVLRRLVSQFVENALKEEQTVARKARERALRDVIASKQALGAADAKLVNFLQEHPAIRDVSPHKELAETILRMSMIDERVVSTRPRLIGYIELIEDARKELGLPDNKEEQVKTEQKAPALSGEDKKAFDELVAKALELEAMMDGLQEMRRQTADRKLRLEEAIREFPVLELQLVKLKRAAKAAEEDWTIALKRFKRVNEAFMNTVEGMVSFSVISPARRPHERD